METINISTSQHVDIDYPVAGVGERIVARLIDLGVFFGLYIFFILVGLVTSSINSSIVILTLVIIYGVSYVFYNLLYEIFLNGQSIGKRVMKIKVISIDGSQPSVGQYFIRWLFRLVDFIFTAQLGGLFCVILSDKKQRIGDIVAGTTVIKTVPRTTFEHIAFHPVEEDYIPVFENVHQLADRDIELVHEVLDAYYKTGNYELIRTMSEKIAAHMSIGIPKDMNWLDFLTTVVKDYKHVTSRGE